MSNNVNIIICSRDSRMTIDKMNEIIEKLDLLVMKSSVRGRRHCPDKILCRSKNGTNITISHIKPMESFRGTKGHFIIYEANDVMNSDIAEYAHLWMDNIITPYDMIYRDNGSRVKIDFQHIKRGDHKFRFSSDVEKLKSLLEMAGKL